MAALLFKGTQPLHGLRQRAQRAMAVAAQLSGQMSHDQTATQAGTPAMPAGLSRLPGRTVAAILDVLATTAEGEARLARLPPAHRTEAQVLAALVEAAQAIAGPPVQAVRLDAIQVRPKSVFITLNGPGARAAARRVGQGCGLWRQAFGRRLTTEIGPASDDDLAEMAARPVDENELAVSALQRVLARLLLDWQAAWNECRAGRPGAPAALHAATQRTSQLLAALRPILKRGPTRRLRAELTRLRRRVTLASRAQAALEDVVANDDANEAAGRLSTLVDTAAEAARAAGGTAVQWTSTSTAEATAHRLRLFISDLPLQRKHEETTLAEAAPGLLLEAADHLVRRQAAFSAGDPASWRRAASAILRLKVAVTALGETRPPNPHAHELVRDLDRAAGHLEVLQRLEAVEQTVVAYLDGWAERQGRRKAPQMHGAEAVLEYRQQRRAERMRELRALAEAWKPIRGRGLRRRAAAVWAGTLS